MKRLSVLMVAAVAATIAASGCGQDSDASRVRPAAVTANTAGSCVKLASGAITQKIDGYREYKRGHGTAPSGERVANAGDWAYASAPVNVPGPGTYTFKFGPIADGLDAPTAFSIFPPDGFTGSIGPSENGAIKEATDPDGKRYLLVDLSVSGNVSPCDNFVAFIA